MSRIKRKKNECSVVNIKRLLFIRGMSFCIFIGLIVRLFYIQVIKYDFYNAEVIKQRQISIPVDSGRGLILDRNFIPLTDRIEQKVAIIFPQHFVANASNVLFLQEITGKEYEELFNKVKNSKYTLEFSVKDDLNWNDRRFINTKGLFIVNKRIRHDSNGFLNHVIGYINQVDLRGMSGIEGAMDGVLSGNTGKSLIATLDGRKKFLPGEGYVVASTNNKSQNLRLTIDYHIQKIAEEVIDESSMPGSVIVSDIQTGEILGMVSRPNFDSGNISYHLKSRGDELYNKAIQMAFPPGSIFKIVVAIEALRQNPLYADEIFECLGYESVGEIEIKCSSYDKGGHGQITMDRAFAESCNCVFIQLAQRIGAGNIINMAEQLGFNNIVDIGLMEENSGNLPSGNDLLGPAYGNIAIGQGQILATPLQVNQLTQLIANNGLKKSLYIMEDIVDNDYVTLKKSNIAKEQQVLDSELAKKLKLWMEKVMLEGSGRHVEEFSNITAGKTGSAESVENGQEVVHAWFTGYYPTNTPKYAVTIFIQNGRSGGGVAVPIFRKIVEKMTNLGYK
ncbi:penicillin-binding protein 2 [Alkaliphilus sp. MSJ-5]|uniref:Penicillin-binding protein 2 n=1 Tax=Alkaliphilus flagellatus TaxID=2841507 RepID=A0ABS6G675_9FIRM|nr:penicillin-binding protein 2 [Alkaliphilus flagellatus]MBU5677982.1 penicillin-binding protein 2 [Alkaliphilus flagellatus]